MWLDEYRNCWVYKVYGIILWLVYICEIDFGFLMVIYIINILSMYNLINVLKREDFFFICIIIYKKIY